jgi:hypothetical protein
MAETMTHVGEVAKTVMNGIGAIMTTNNQRRNEKMGLKAKDVGGDFELIEAGIHPAACYAYYDLGIHGTPQYGDKHQVIVCFETLNEKMEDGRPFGLSKFYTLTLGKDSNLRNDLESWRGREFTDEEKEGFDLDNIIGAACQLNVIHEKKDGKTRVKIKNVLPRVKGSNPTTTPENAMVMYQWGMEIPEHCPDFIKKKIEEGRNPNDEKVEEVEMNVPDEVTDIEPF